MTTTASAAYHALMRRRAIRAIRRDDDDEEEDTEGGDEATEEGEKGDDEDEGEEREDGADGLRAHMQRRYGVDLSKTPAITVARRAATILGVSLDGMSDAAAISLTAIRADGEWSEDDHPRAEDGKFSAAGGASEKAAKATESAGDRHGGHADALDAHRSAAMAHRVAGNDAVAEAHDRAANAHELAARAQARAVGNSTAEGQRQRSLVGTHANQASAASREALAASKATGDHFQRRVGDPSPAGASKAQLLAAARAATDRAMTTQSMEDHRKAAEANRAAGREGTAKSHDSAVKNLERNAHLAPAVSAPQSGAAQHVHADTHAANAQRYADNAKTAASGTSPAARASARKAAESAALAKVAAGHGDHVAAAQHAQSASAHAAAAIQKANAHRASQSDQSPAVSSNAGRDLKAEAKAAAQTLGRQQQQEIDQKRSVDRVTAAHAARDAAQQATARANEASRQANAIDTPAAHAEAAREHARALTANRAIGNAAGSGHAQAADSHDIRSAQLAAQMHGRTVAEHAAVASREAVSKTMDARSTAQHLVAQGAHEEAARAQRAAGDSSMANLHEHAMDSHGRAASGSTVHAEYARGEAQGIERRLSPGGVDAIKPRGSIASATTRGSSYGVARDQASEATKTARVQGTDAAHQEAAGAHVRAASEARLSGLSGAASYHDRAAKDHQDAAQSAFRAAKASPKKR